MTDLRQLLYLSDDLDEKSTRLLLRAIKDNNKDGFDYLEFLMSVRKLQDMEMDETTAIKSAFATASSFGLSKDTLVSSGHFYVSVLRKEYEQFKSALERQIEKKIAEPETRIEKMEKEFGDIDLQIEKLRQKKVLLKNKVKEMRAKIKNDRSDLTEREKKFNTTFETIKAQIESHISNIEDQLES